MGVEAADRMSDSERVGLIVGGFAGLKSLGSIGAGKESAVRRGECGYRLRKDLKVGANRQRL